MSGTSAESRERRRIYNRRYMRNWRRLNLDLARVRNREYQRRAYDRRKVEMAQREADAESGVKRCYDCGAVATEKIERVNLWTWEPVTVPYCGRC